jgi:LPXTG-site transpeptidase (sortase) family protein
LSIPAIALFGLCNYYRHILEIETVMLMLRWVWVVIIAAMLTSCAAYQGVYVDALAAQLPAASGGRTVHIPRIGVHADITTFPLGATTWEISPWERNAGQLAHLGWIDSSINTVIAAHSEYPSGEAGIFSELDTLRAGDVIFVRDNDLQRAYIVNEIQLVDYRDLTPLYPTTDNRLTLITCSIPSYVAAQNLYYERVIVVAYAVEDE